MGLGQLPVSWPVVTLVGLALLFRLLSAAPSARAAVGLGFLAAPLAILPTIQFGIGDDNRCQGLIARGRKAG